MLKKITAALLVLIIALSGLCSCGGTETKNEGLQIVCSIFPYYDWVRNLTEGAENVAVTLLLDSGTDFHSYQPAAKDIVKISSADLFIYTDGSSDKWVSDVLKTSTNDSAAVLPMMTNLPEDSLFCVEAAGEEHHAEDVEHNHQKDEHIWLSVKNALRLCEIIKNVLCDIDEKNAGIYKQNFINYCSELERLDNAYLQTITEGSKDTVVFADRFPFVYLINDYSLSYHAAFSGCSADSNASFETVTRLAGKIDELGLSCILITEASDGSVAKTIRDCTRDKNQEILTVDSMQSVSADKAELSYIEIMEDNLEVIRKALF